MTYWVIANDDWMMTSRTVSVIADVPPAVEVPVLYPVVVSCIYDDDNDESYIHIFIRLLAGY